MLRFVSAIVALCAAVIVIKDARHWRTGDRRHASFRTVAVSVVILLGLSLTAHARPSPYPPMTQFNGDRYEARAQMGADVVRAIRSQRKTRQQRAPVVRRIGLAEGMTRELDRAVSGRPRAWCGWWLGRHLGMPQRHLWLARNWASVGTNAGGPQVGAVVVWRHHVGIITGRNALGWIVKSGNDGHAVRERVRSVAGAIAFRRV